MAHGTVQANKTVRGTAERSAVTAVHVTPDLSS